MSQTYKVPKIVIVDDSEFLREAIKKFLEDFECSVVSASDGVTGIQTIVEEKPDLVILDLLMPNLSGIDLLKVIKMFDETKEIPIMVITATKDTYLVKQAMDLGVKQIVYKPLTRKTIMDAIEEVLGSRVLTDVKMKKLQEEQEREKKAELEFEFVRPKAPMMLRRELMQFFLKSVEQKKMEILSALEVKNEVMLKNTVHELRGAGTTVGYPKLTLLGEFIENKIKIGMDETQWREVEIYSLQVVSLLELIQEENE